MRPMRHSDGPCETCGKQDCEGAPRFKGVCPAQSFVSNHDRGAFGKLLAEAKALGSPMLSFVARLDEPPESEVRWLAYGASSRTGEVNAKGRTGEEALRRLVEKLRT